MATVEMIYLTAVALLIITVVAADTPAAPAPTKYINHTVGGDGGWFFNTTTNTTSANYSSWAAAETFNLGDFLIFNSNTNQTLFETYNETTYRSCSTDEDDNDDTFQYGGGNSQFGEAITIAVPLTMEGPTYYFSGANDGVQCQHGMAFKIVVNHGLGLPPSLNQPPPPPYATPPSSSDAQSPPITVGANKPNGGGMRNGANLLWVLSALVFAGGLAVM